MANIYKFDLEWKPVQTVRCKAVKILDIQIQNGKPVMWAVTSAFVEERDVGIIMQGTGTDVLSIVEDYSHVSTIQCDGYVWHWFTDFNYQYAEGEEK